MKFQFENDMRIPFFFFFIRRNLSLKYKDKYLDYLHSGSYYSGYDYTSKKTNDINILFGWQIEANSVVSIPLIFYGEYQHYRSYAYYYESGGNTEYADSECLNGFLGSGLIINTDIVKGGIYLGYSGKGFPDDPYSHKGGGDIESYKIAFAPIINTSRLAHIGKVFDNVYGYLGNGDAVIYSTDKVFDEGNSKVNNLNVALELTFSKVNFGPLALQAKTIYSRGNYDAVSKNDVYGLKLQGLYSNLPIGFSLEGGYKHLYYVSQWFEEDYANTGYFSGSIYYPFDNVDVGAIYRYDNIYKSKISFAVSSNIVSGHLTHNPIGQYSDKERFSGGKGADFGLRYYHGGWRTKPNE
jgi:hypothetical protein